MKSLALVVLTVISSVSFAEPTTRRTRATYVPPSCSSEEAMLQGLIKIRDRHPGKEIYYNSEIIKGFDGQGNYREVNGADVVENIQFVYAYETDGHLEVKRVIQPADNCSSAALVDYVPGIQSQSSLMSRSNPPDCTRQQTYNAAVQNIAREYPNVSDDKIVKFAEDFSNRSNRPVAQGEDVGYVRVNFALKNSNGSITVGYQGISAFRCMTNSRSGEMGTSSQKVNESISYFQNETTSANSSDSDSGSGDE